MNLTIPHCIGAIIVHMVSQRIQTFLRRRNCVLIFSFFLSLKYQIFLVVFQLVIRKAFGSVMYSVYYAASISTRQLRRTYWLGLRERSELGGSKFPRLYKLPSCQHYSPGPRRFLAIIDITAPIYRATGITV